MPDKQLKTTAEERAQWQSVWSSNLVDFEQRNVPEDMCADFRFALSLLHDHNTLQARLAAAEGSTWIILGDRRLHLATILADAADVLREAHPLLANYPETHAKVAEIIATCDVLCAKLGDAFDAVRSGEGTILHRETAELDEYDVPKDSVTLVKKED